jgi:hypothetical protein
MSVFFADDCAKRDRVWHAPPRHPIPEDAGIRPILERLRRDGERWTDASPPLLPDLPENEMLPSPGLALLERDSLSVIGKVSTIAICLAVLAAPGLYVFASGGAHHVTAREIAAPASESRPTQAPSVTPESTPAAAQPIASEPKRSVPSAPSATQPGFDADFALIAPISLWGIFPTEAASAVAAAPSQDPEAKDAPEPVTNSPQASQAAPVTTVPQAQPAEQHVRSPHRTRRKNVARLQSEGSEPALSEAAQSQPAQAQAIGSAQNDASTTPQPNPIEAAFRAIFGVAQ